MEHLGTLSTLQPVQRGLHPLPLLVMQHRHQWGCLRMLKKSLLSEMVGETEEAPVWLLGSAALPWPLVFAHHRDFATGVQDPGQTDRVH